MNVIMTWLVVRVCGTRARVCVFGIPLLFGIGSNVYAYDVFRILAVCEGYYYYRFGLIFQPRM